MRFLLIILILIFNSSYAVTLDELQQRFNHLPIQRAEFQQERTIKGLSQPLRSSGHVLISHQYGLIWQQTTPFSLSLILTKDRMSQHIPGQQPQVITAESNPQMFRFNHLLTALFSADYQLLEENFSINFQSIDNTQWKIILIPNKPPLDKLFSRFELTGNNFVEAINIDDKQGDKTVIHFYNHSTTPDKLTDEESHNFLF